MKMKLEVVVVVEDAQVDTLVDMDSPCRMVDMGSMVKELVEVVLVLVVLLMVNVK